MVNVIPQATIGESKQLTHMRMQSEKLDWREGKSAGQ